MMEKLKAEIEELKVLEAQATQTRVKDILTTNIRRFETELIHLMEHLNDNEKLDNGTTKTKQHVDHIPDKNTKSMDSTKLKVYTVQMTSFAWDQSDKFFKIYLTQNLSGIQNHDSSKIIHTFSPRSLHVAIQDFNKKNYELYIHQLYDEIIPAESSLKVKQDMVLLMLKKKNISKTWPGVSKADDKSKDKKVPPIDKNKDPNESLMDMMKQMYEDGDDEMKRTIAKAWSESRDKNKGMGI